MWMSPKIGAIAFLHWTVKLMFGLSMADFKQHSSRCMPYTQFHKLLLLGTVTTIVWIPHHAGWLVNIKHADASTTYGSRIQIRFIEPSKLQVLATTKSAMFQLC